MSRYDMLTGKSTVQKEIADKLLEFDSDTRVLLNISKDRYITAFLRQDNQLYYAAIMGNVGAYKSTVWKMIVADSEGEETYEEACNQLINKLPVEYRNIRILSR